MIPDKACSGLDPGENRFPAFAKPASAGEARSEKFVGMAPPPGQAARKLA